MKTYTIDDWRQFFPFDRVRPEQETAINFILNAFLCEGKRFVCAEMGTGTGKSATGITVSRFLAANPHPELIPADLNAGGGSYVLTTQKVLQEQYVSDFGPGKKDLLRSIKSSSNYTCNFYADQNCGESRRILSKLGKQLAGTEFFKCCRSSCPYGIDKQAFIESPISITNFSYFLAETMYAKKLEPRQLLIIDEAHNIETQVSKFVEISFSEKFAKEVLKCKLPVLKGDEDAKANIVFAWIEKTYKPKLAKHIAGLEKALENKLNSGTVGFGEFSKQYEMLDKHICKVNRFISTFDVNNWVMNVIEPTFTHKRSGRRFEFKPIDVSSYGHDMLYRFGSRVLMMSATIIDRDVFCRTIGIDPTDVAFIRLPSPFPIQNRPIHYLRVGKMSMDNIDATLPKIAEIVEMLLEKHADVKGMIHCVSFKVAKYLFENVKSNRLIIHNSENRDLVLKEHVDGLRPTVLLSPSMMEGVDLADDASRFQVLCKVPFPYLGDKVVKKRKAKDQSWYPFQTVKSVIQSMGRSVRNETDHAVSYILDEDWEYFYMRNKHLFPDDFQKSISVI